MEIGPTLREARMRRRISIDEIEEATKIRTKYLRALENEEWAVLPGPAYVRSFLRTYAQALGLDAQLLVDEYRRTHDRVTTAEQAGYREPLLSKRGPRDPQRRFRPGRGPVVAGLVIALIAALFVLGSLGSDDESPEQAAVTTETKPAARPQRTETTEKPQRTEPTLARVTVGADGPVWVCLVDATGARRINARVLEAGETAGPYRSKRFLATFGNGNARLRLNGKALEVPQSSEPLGYRITPTGRKTIGEDERPTCGG